MIVIKCQNLIEINFLNKSFFGLIDGIFRDDPNEQARLIF